MAVPRKKTGGRKRGVPNVMTRNIREAINQAFNELGGVDYLVELGRTDPRVFAALLARLLPPEGNNTQAVDIGQRIKEARQRLRKARMLSLEDDQQGG